MNRSDVRLGTRVVYKGHNRTYLKEYPQARLNGQYSSLNSSAQVEFLDENGKIGETAWVGLGYLEKKDFIHQATIDELSKKRDEIKNQIDGFEAAIKALQDLG